MQRPPTATGYRLDTFADVVLRHGLAMGAIAIGALVITSAWPLLVTSTEALRAAPMPYAVATLALIVFFALWSKQRRELPTREALWLLYLLYISIVEEIAFRLVIPQFLAQETSLLLAHTLSNALFATLHYFTLRWRLANCVGTFLGAMGLSHLMGYGDLALVILVHWLGTFLNTPVPPSRAGDR